MCELTTVIPVYNGERYIAETLTSIAQQTRRPDRVVILDNVSTDRTREIVEGSFGSCCEWRQNETNVGLFGNLNRALGFAAETEFLHLLHADDRIKPEFYERSLSALTGTSGRSLSVAGVEFIDAEGRALKPAPRARGSPPSKISNIRFIKERSELRPIYFPSVVLKTDRIASPCEFRTDMPQLADHVFWAEWAVHCKEILQISDVLAEYRIHPDADTARNAKNLQRWVADEWKAMETIAGLLNERSLARAVRRERRKVIFAARSAMKLEETKINAPAGGDEIRRLTRAHVSAVHWATGKTAAFLKRKLTTR